jgi:hypothetical protein
MKTYTIPKYGITVKVMGPSGTIESELKKELIGDDPSNDPELLAVVDALESLILAHACQGLDISSPAYVAGIESSLEALGNHYS